MGMYNDILNVVMHNIVRLLSECSVNLVLHFLNDFLHDDFNFASLHEDLQ